MTIVERVQNKQGNYYERHYTRGKFLGKGSYARAYEVTNTKTNITYAGKIFDKASLKPNQLDMLKREISIHKSLNHKNIVQFHHHFEDDLKVYILLELWQNRTLRDLLKQRKRLTEHKIRCFGQQLTQALNYLHSQHVIHRDIKVENWFVNEFDELKLGDFGLSVEVEFAGQKHHQIWGTPMYIAPELLNRNVGYSYECDIWSLGCLFYTLLTGSSPFTGRCRDAIYNKIRTVNYEWPEDIQVSNAAKQLVSSWLVLNVRTRASADRLLSDPFFKNSRVMSRALSASMSGAILTDFKQALQPHNASIQPFKSRNTERPYKHLRPTIFDQSLNLSRSSNAPLNESAESKPNSPVMVESSLDLTKNHGWFYVLNTGSIGVLFNDESKIICNPNWTHFRYGEPKISHKNFVAQDSEYALDECPREIQRKLGVLQHFSKHLSITNPIPSEEIIYVQKCQKSTIATIFTLSNGTVHGKFEDGAQIVMTAEARTITSINKLGEVEVLDLAQADRTANVSIKVKHLNAVLRKNSSTRRSFLVGHASKN